MEGGLVGEREGLGPKGGEGLHGEEDYRQLERGCQDSVPPVTVFQGPDLPREEELCLSLEQLATIRHKGRAQHRSAVASAAGTGSRAALGVAADLEEITPYQQEVHLIA
ncbi:unnamed protein product, partial [Discosporangium mesarthrocarpum]